MMSQTCVIAFLFFNVTIISAQKMKFATKDFFSKGDQIRRKLLRIWSHVLKKSLMENFIFCGVKVPILSSLNPYFNPYCYSDCIHEKWVFKSNQRLEKAKRMQ